ncbi:MAG: PIN domain-containing protein [Micrococcales bacterium]|nr:PIN domain-containing protein [Micrococcales bacterium]
MRLVADTGGIVTALNQAEPDHRLTRAVLEAAALVVVTPLVICEVHHVLTAGGARQAAADFLTDVAEGFYRVVNPSEQDYATARDLVAKYGGGLHRKRQKPGSLDLTDALNVVVAAAVGTNLLVAFDQDYRVVRPLSGHPAFVLLPTDGS